MDRVDPLLERVLPIWREGDALRLGAEMRGAEGADRRLVDGAERTPGDGALRTLGDGALRTLGAEYRGADATPGLTERLLPGFDRNGLLGAGV